MNNGPDADARLESVPDDRDKWATGRYLADNGRWFVQLRIGAGNHPTVSADLQIKDVSGLVEVSMTTRPFTNSRDGGGAAGVLDEDHPPDVDWLDSDLEAVYSDAQGGLSPGTVRVHVNQVGLVTVTFLITRGVAGLIPGFTVTVTAARVSTALRDVGLEVEYESGIEKYFTSGSREELRDAAEDLQEVLHQAGLDVHRVGSSTIVDSPPGGVWSGSDVFTALNNQLRNAAQAPLTSPVWELHLLLLSKTDRDGLLGVMFDYVDTLPRQGAAVFVEAVKQRCPDEDDFPTRVLVTAVHELGHCLNLTHRFTREVGRADSPSYMNYDWLYRGGNQVDQYWKDRRDPVRPNSDPNAPKKRSFDSDELEFLRHGPRDQVIPGGAPFGSARYWTTGTGGSVSPPANPEKDLQLWLTSAATGTTVDYLDPVFLQVSLRNAGDASRFMPRYVLDVKAGMLEILVQRQSRRAGLSAADGEQFVPFMRRCYSMAAEQSIWLRPGESLHNNVNLTFGSAGFPLAEPGEYLITPVLTLFNGYPDPIIDPQNDPVLTVVLGAGLPITILPPRSAARRRDSDLVLRTDVGASLALGGADCLTAASETLRAIIDRRRQDDRGGRPDGLVAAAARMLGLNAARHQDRDEAIRWLDVATQPTALATFDPHTAEHTRRKAREVAHQPADTTRVYLDLAVQVNGATQQRYPVPGVLVTRDMSHAVDTPASLVLVDASSFADQTVVRASAIVSADDGSTEQVNVHQLDVCGVNDRPVAVAHLDRDLPGPSSIGAIDLQRLWGDDGATATGVRNVLADVGITIPPASDDRSGAGPLRTVAAAEQAAPWAMDDTTSSATESNIRGWYQVASIWCWFTNRCGEGPPGDGDGRPHGKGQAAIPDERPKDRKQTEAT